jgi:hypothetical protein
MDWNCVTAMLVSRTSIDHLIAAMASQHIDDATPACTLRSPSRKSVSRARHAGPAICCWKKDGIVTLNVTAVSLLNEIPKKESGEMFPTFR